MREGHRMQPENNNQPTDNPEGATPAPSTSPENNLQQPVLTPVQSRADQQDPIQGQPLTQPPVKNNAKKKKLLLIGGIIAAVVVLAGGSVGAYFGLYLPNQPDKIWENSLENSAKSYDRFVDSTKKREAQKGGNFKGNFKYDSKEVVVDGNIEAKYDDKDAIVKVDAGASGVRFTLDMLAATPEGAKYPDLYTKVGGLKGLDQVLGAEAGGIGASLAAYDNQWYVADHTLFDQLEKEAGSSAGTSTTPLTKEQMNAIYDAVGRVNREYIFTTDESKAVLTRTQNVGKEQYDGRDAYHYKVSYKKDRLKAYVAALNTELQKTELKNFLTAQEITSINSSIDKIDDTKPADAWVDLDTDLIRNVRFTTNEQKGEAIDVGQKYNGGDEVPFFVGLTSKEKGNDGTATLVVTANLKSDDLKIKSDIKANDNGQPFTFTFNGNLTASNEDVKVDKPADAKSIMELFGQFLSSGMGGAETMDMGTPGSTTL